VAAASALEVRGSKIVDFACFRVLLLFMNVFMCVRVRWQHGNECSVVAASVSAVRLICIFELFVVFELLFFLFLLFYSHTYFTAGAGLRLNEGSRAVVAINVIYDSHFIVHRF
jgi:hypothetical protein